MFATNRNLDATTFSQRSNQSHSRRDKSRSSGSALKSLPAPSPNRRAPSTLSDTLIPSSIASSPATKRLPAAHLNSTSSTGHCEHANDYPQPIATSHTPRAGRHSGPSPISKNVSSKVGNDTLGKRTSNKKSRKRKHKDEPIPNARKSAKRTTKHTASRRERDGRGSEEKQGHSNQAPSCCLCDIYLASLPRRQCLDCPHIHFCIPCSITARDIHPGHTLYFRKPGDLACGPEPERPGEVITIESEISGEDGSSGEIDHEKALTVRRRRAAGETCPDLAALARMTQAMTKAIDGMVALRSAAEQLLRSHDARSSRSLDAPEATSIITHSLLEFPVDFATLKSQSTSDQKENDDSDLDYVPRRRKGRLHKRWTDNDRRRLKKLKEQGLTFAEIGHTLSRTEGAVSQEWRELSM